MSADMEFESAAERALYLSKQVATLTRERGEALNVIRELRCKLAEAGVEGSPPAGETTIGALMRQRDEALADAARCRELLTKSLTFIWDMNRPSVMRRFEQEDAVRAALADTTSEAWLAERLAAQRDEALEEARADAARKGEALERAEADRDALRQQLEAEATAIIERLTRERDEARASHNKTLDAIRVDCDVHHGARRECGQCYDSQGQYLKNVTAERDEARAELLKYQALHSNTETKLHEARADAARKGEALKLTEEALTIHVMADAVCEMGADAGDELAVSMARAALAETTSEAWLAEVRATARDEALEEAADCFGMTADQERIRALKRGGK